MRARASAIAARHVVPAPSAGTVLYDAVLFEGDAEALHILRSELAAGDGPIVPVLAAAPGGGPYPPDMLLAEHVTSTNTTAAGGNATLMSL